MVANRRAEVVAEDAREALATLSTSAWRPAEHIAERPKCKPSIEAHEEIHRLQRKMDPFPTEKNPAMPGPIDQIISEHRFDISEDVFVTGGMEAMTAVVEALSLEFEAARIPSDRVSLFEQCNAGSIQLPKSEGACHSRRSTAEYYHMGFSRATALETEEQRARISLYL